MRIADRMLLSGFGYLPRDGWYRIAAMQGIRVGWPSYGRNITILADHGWCTDQLSRGFPGVRKELPFCRITACRLPMIDRSVERMDAWCCGLFLVLMGESIFGMRSRGDAWNRLRQDQGNALRCERLIWWWYAGFLVIGCAFWSGAVYASLGRQRLIYWFDHCCGCTSLPELARPAGGVRPRRTRTGTGRSDLVRAVQSAWRLWVLRGHYFLFFFFFFFIFFFFFFFFFLRRWPSSPVVCTANWVVCLR